MEKALPAIPAKRYFTIGEVSELCGVKPYVLRYWEQEFTQLRPMKRRGNRRYYQHHEVLLIRRIRELLYERGFTISGARNQLADMGQGGVVPVSTGVAASAEGRQAAASHPAAEVALDPACDAPAAMPLQRKSSAADAAALPAAAAAAANDAAVDPVAPAAPLSWSMLRAELLAIRELLHG